MIRIDYECQYCGCHHAAVVKGGTRYYNDGGGFKPTATPLATASAWECRCVRSAKAFIARCIEALPLAGIGLQAVLAEMIDEIGPEIDYLQELADDGLIVKEAVKTAAYKKNAKNKKNT